MTREPLDTVGAIHKITVIGAGTMGRAIATGMVDGGVVSPAHLSVVDRTPESAERLATDLGARDCADIATACEGASVVLVCVKPMDVAEVARQLAVDGVLAQQTLVVSIAAGVRIAALEAALPSGTAVIRVMPNTASLIRRGMAVISAGAHATTRDSDVAHAIFSTVGRCMSLEEKHLDAVTALSASGPAFIYVMMEALADGGVMVGLPRAVAMELIAQATLGAAEMVLATGRHPASLKDDVTTPGGCTIAGLLTLEDGGVRSALAKTIERTARVASELGRTAR